MMLIINNGKYYELVYYVIYYAFLIEIVFYLFYNKNRNNIYIY